MDLLKSLNKSSCFLHHFKDYRSNIVTFFNALYKHYHEIVNISKDTYATNILDKIEKLSKKYECK